MFITLKMLFWGFNMVKTDIKKSSVQAGETIASARVLELRRKIHDNGYMDSAIQRIAQVISNRLVDNSVQRFIHR